MKTKRIALAALVLAVSCGVVLGANTRKFAVGDCVVRFDSDQEIWEQKGNSTIKRVIELGNHSYHTASWNGNVFSELHYSRNSVDFSDEGSYKKVECPK